MRDKNKGAIPHLNQSGEGWHWARVWKRRWRWRKGRTGWEGGGRVLRGKGA